MQIQWFGQSFFKISTKNSKGEEVVIAIDPFCKDYGYKMPNKFQADLALVSHDHPDHNNLDILKGTQGVKPFVIDGPGEYEAKGVLVYAIESFHDEEKGTKLGENNMFLIYSEEMCLAHLGDYGQKEFSDEQLQKIKNVDILLLPVGGVFTINAAKAAEVVTQLEPRVVIPMHYDLPGLKIAGNKKLDGVDNFVKELGLKAEKVENSKAKIVKKNLPQDNTQLLVLNP